MTGYSKLKYFLKALVGKLKLISIFVNNICNNNCKYCLSNKGNKKINLANVKKGISSSNGGIIGLLGGEPFNSPNLLQKIVENATNCLVFILTDLRQINHVSVVESLITSGLTGLVIAVDSMSQVTTKNYITILPKLHSLMKLRKKYGTILIFNCTITEEGAPEITRLINNANTLQIPIMFHLITPEETKLVDPLAVSFNMDFAIPILQGIIKAKQKGSLILNPLQQLEEIRSRLADNNKPWNCPAGGSIFFMNTEGKSIPCFNKTKDIIQDVSSSERYGIACSDRCLSTCCMMFEYYNTHILQLAKLLWRL